MNRCWLKGSDGDALHAVLCAAGFNIRWQLRAIARLGLHVLLLALNALAPHGRLAVVAPGRGSKRCRPSFGYGVGGRRHVHPMVAGWISQVRRRKRRRSGMGRRMRWTPLICCRATTKPEPG